MMANSGTEALTLGPESLLPWRATGRLSPPETRRIDTALTQDAVLARTYAGIRQESVNIVRLNERMGAPSPRALLALFAAIDLDSAMRKQSS
ncbi:MAG: hypothetical protein JWP21_656 [Tardiphaga sp.]|nr:hypothetical protein [Tardiphaga sp.]